MLVCCLRELCFVEPTDQGTTLWLSGTLLASLLLPVGPCDTPQGDGCQTIGSQLSSLSLNVSDFEGFLEELVENAHKIQLDTLRFVELDVAHCRALKTCILKMPRLRNLHLARVLHPSESSRIILNMLQQCETLQTLVVEKHYCDRETGLLFDDAGLHLAEGYCQRISISPSSWSAKLNWVNRPPATDLYRHSTQHCYKLPSKSRHWSLSSSLEKLGDCVGPDSTAF
jgi:hypothetical protein